MCVAIFATVLIAIVEVAMGRIRIRGTVSGESNGKSWISIRSRENRLCTSIITYGNHTITSLMQQFMEENSHSTFLNYKCPIGYVSVAFYRKRNQSIKTAVASHNEKAASECRDIHSRPPLTMPPKSRNKPISQEALSSFPQSI